MPKREKWVLKVHTDPDYVIMTDDLKTYWGLNWSDGLKRQWTKKHGLTLQWTDDEVAIDRSEPIGPKATLVAPVLEDERVQAPSSAFVSALLPAASSEDVIANLNQIFADTWVPRHGAKTARRIWMSQAVQLVLLQWAAPILNVIDKLRGLLRLL